jgi:hypothetical protein
MKISCALLLLLSLFPLTRSSFAVENVQQILQVDLKDADVRLQQAFFELGLDVTSLNRADKTVEVLVDGKEIEQLEKLGLKTTVRLTDANEFARQLRASGYLDHFRNYETMIQQLENWVSQHPEIARLEDIGDSYDKIAYQAGHDIWAIKISDNVQVEEDEPEIFIMANLHAREIITPEIVMVFMEYLFNNYGSDPYVTYLVNHRQIWIVPSANPDGHEYVMTGENPTDRTYTDPFWWRKNKQDNNHNGRFDPDYDGVDLNRNFGYKWGLDNIGSSGSPSSDLYRGTGPFSEPESQVIRDFTIAHNFKISVSFHSYSQLWLYPWGYANLATPDHATFIALADSCVAYNGYTPEKGAELYLVNGDTDDWFYGEQTTKNKIFAFTPEVGNTAESVGGWTGFFPDTLYIEKQIKENQGPLFYLIYAAGEEPVIEPILFPDTENATGPYETPVIVRSSQVLTEAAEIDVANIKLYYNTSGINAPFDSTTLDPTPDSEIFRASLPAQGDETTIYYYFAATDKMGRTGHAPRMAPLAVHSFAVGADLIAPEIQHTPITDQTSRIATIPIQAQIRDNGEISQALVVFSQNSGVTDTLQMTEIDGANTYQALLEPATITPGDFFDYRIIAMDQARNKNSTAAPAIGFYRFRILPGILFDFEENNGGFTSNSTGDWEWGIPTSGPGNAHSGQKVWATKLSGDYRNNSNSRLDTPPIDLFGHSKAYLTFWHWYENETSSSLWDGGNVKISANNGPFEIMTPVDGYDGIIDEFNTMIGGQPGFGGAQENGNFWHKELFDLSQYLGSEVKIRFHFGSDNNTTLAGWYLDDVELLLLPLAPPMISDVSILPHTTDNLGPYRVQASIADDDGINTARLWFSTNASVNFSPVSMEKIGENRYEGAIPGQPYTTTVRYYVQASDNSGAEAFEPALAPEMTYQFWVTDRVPTIEIRPESFDFALEPDSLYVDSLQVANLGLLELQFQVRDSLFSPMNLFEHNFRTTDFDLDWSAISLGIKESVFKNADKMKGLAHLAAENPAIYTAAETRQFSHLPENGLSGDLLALHAQLTPTAINLTIDFVELSHAFVVLSLNTDEKTTTGCFNTSVAGADFHLIWDLENSFGLKAPAVILVNADFSECLGTVPLAFRGKSAAADIPRAALSEYDGNFTFAAISISDNAELLGRLPENQNFIFGKEATPAWLSVTPQSAQVGGEDTTCVILKINTQSLVPGDYSATLFFRSNDPNRPDVPVPVKIKVKYPSGVEVTAPLSARFQLLPNFPNPFNPETTLKYQLGTAAAVDLKIFNVTGQLVRTLVQTIQPAGVHEVVWDGKNELGAAVSSGVYLIKISAGNFAETQKMLLLQ